ncbi:rod shape-determining protein MreC [Clostridium sp. JN-1]|uniref:rod shape-determining protein MreC n=1 Tax=Clostridium sp. JN-1 TaxID=2483110 RepID=UPI000F0B0B83|nr:rod shape-determining protein MreC [Clostridium sp. JN-1]
MKIFKNKLAVAIVVLSVTFLILITQGFRRNKLPFLENSIGAAFNPVQGTIYKLNNGVKNFVGFIFNFSDVKTENEQLKKKNSELENKLVEYNSLKSDNDNLRKMLNFKNQRSEYDYLGCDIIGKSGDGVLDQFIINKGSKSGIEKQMIVVTAEGLVGQITKVGSSWSIVQTLSNENIAVSATIESTDENSGVVKGYKDSDNKLLTQLCYLPESSNVKKGDVILTSGLGGFYPKGIRIGSVIDVQEDKGKVMKNAIVKPYVDFNKINEVFVVIPKNKIDVKY